MKFIPSLQQGKLVRRYKRFLTDVLLADGQERTIHCPNTGSMKNCLFEGEDVWFSESDNPKRKYPNTWEIAQTDEGHLIGINTGRANHLATEAIEQQVIPELAGYETLKKEVKYGNENSRIDILLTAPEQPNCYVEIKSCTLLEDNSGYFPDAVTTRGQKHLRELMEMAAQGHRAVLLFIVQHTGIDRVSPAAHIDPEYSALLKQAANSGVEIIAYGTTICPEEIKVTHAVDVLLDECI
ncbi:DNA/RNA nuclease SfsA [Shewanella gelidii]|uniref:Sugar fermentation stimulation protein homolog n=1 Tax=Shewanella gelidii TaxID=1642821 RepID=A0A917N751_9GAMM|nr:DNA/RNA nuclease SfsA [Shewanella gelidii]MCL1096868.1 DNA/RNA nuclease SfsA [Shewanella gelidii]GGI70756.1 sugar fermentation stimulation protein [Shewanella gelidii]